tara:strand:- start:1028 stop:1363 length:336 start_codon:yes stop_codon:yes gene_type:complete
MGFRPNHFTVRSVANICQKTLCDTTSIQDVRVIADIHDNKSIVLTYVTYNDGNYLCGYGKGHILEDALTKSCREINELNSGKDYDKIFNFFKDDTCVIIRDLRNHSTFIDK